MTTWLAVGLRWRRRWIGAVHNCRPCAASELAERQCSQEGNGNQPASDSLLHVLHLLSMRSEFRIE
jgi:hypothetical protein